MRALFCILLAVLGTYGVLGEKSSKNSGCSCIKGYLKPKPSNISVPDAFKKFRITPDYVPVPPKDILLASYVTANVEIGQFIEPIRTLDPKNVTYPKGKANVKYTLLVLDLDGPQTSPSNVYVIGINVNVPNSDNLMTSGDIIVPFTPRPPNLASGVHRPTGLLYEQKNHIDPNQQSFLKLAKFRFINLDQFIKTYKLNPKPAAGTFYTTELRRC